MRFLIIISLCFCFCFCSRQKSADLNKSSQTFSRSFFKIRYEDILNSRAVVKLSQIASDVEYVQLETQKYCKLGKGLIKYFFTDEFIFVQDFDHILKFSREGKFLKIVGTPGLGRGEIDLIKNMSIIPDKKLICVQTSRGKELLFFSFNGKLKKSLTYKQYNTYKPIAQDRFIAYDRGSSGKNKYNFALLNGNMDTLSFVKNYITFELPKVGRVSVGYPSFDPFCCSTDKIFLKSMYSDTVYSVISDKIEPEYLIDLGKYRLPDELRFERLNEEGKKILKEKINDYYFSNVFHSGEKIFLTLYSFGDAPSKCVFFDMNTQQGSLLVNNDRVPTGFINDWDGGMNFWPSGMISGNKLFMPVRIADLKKQLGRNTAKSVKYQDKQQELIKMISESDLADNPVLMIVTLK